MMAISNFGDWSATSAAPLPEATTEAVPTDQEASDFAALLAASYAVSGAAPVPAVAGLPAEATLQGIDVRPVTSAFSLPKDVLRPNAPPPTVEQIAADAKTEVSLPMVVSSGGLPVREVEKPTVSAGNFTQIPEAIRPGAKGQSLPQLASVDNPVTNIPPETPRVMTSPDQTDFRQDGVTNLATTSPFSGSSERISAHESRPDVAEAIPAIVRPSESFPVASSATHIATQMPELPPQHSAIPPVDADGTVRFVPHATIPTQSASLATMDTAGNVTTTADFSALKSIVSESRATITQVSSTSEAQVIEAQREELSPLVDRRLIPNSMSGVPAVVKLAAATIRTIVLPPDTPTPQALAMTPVAAQPDVLPVALGGTATTNNFAPTFEGQPESADVLTLETVTPLETGSGNQVESLNTTVIPVSSLIAAEQEQTEQKPAQADYSPASDREVVSKLSRSISLPPGEIQAVPEITLAARSNLGTAVSAHVFAHELDRSSTLALQAEFDAGAFTEKEGLSAKMNFGAIGQPTLITNAINAPIQAEAAAGSDAQSLIEQTAQPVIETAPRTEAGETRSLRLELNPIELGRVEVEITRDAEGRVSASLTAEQTETAQTLTHNLGHLRETLERAGLVIEQLQVTTAPPLQTQTSQQFGQQPNQQQTSPNHHHNRASFGSEQMVGEDTTPASDNRLLSMRA